SYVDDVALPGMLHVAFARSPIARGRIRGIDASEARRTPGVWAVYTAQDLLPLNIEMLSTQLVSPPPGPKVHPLALDRVAYVGDPVALVVADDRYVAEDAASLVQIDYEPEAPVVTIEDARSGPPIHPEFETN